MKVVFAAVVALLAVSACSTAQKVTPISQAEVNNVFDLSDLGEISYDNENIMFNNRPISDGVDFSDIGRGRDTNLLGLSYEVLASLPPDLADKAISARSDELRLFLKTQGLTVQEVRLNQNKNREIDTSILKKLTLLSQQRVGITSENKMMLKVLANIPSNQK
jgi:hypothetical protein